MTQIVNPKLKVARRCLEEIEKYVSGLDESLVSALDEYLSRAIWTVYFMMRDTLIISRAPCREGGKEE